MSYIRDLSIFFSRLQYHINFLHVYYILIDFISQKNIIIQKKSRILICVNIGILINQWSFLKIKIIIQEKNFLNRKTQEKKILNICLNGVVLHSHELWVDQHRDAEKPGTETIYVVRTCCVCLFSSK